MTTSPSIGVRSAWAPGKGQVIGVNTTSQCSAGTYGRVAGVLRPLADASGVVRAHGRGRGGRGRALVGPRTRLRHPDVRRVVRGDGRRRCPDRAAQPDRLALPGLRTAE